MRAIGRDALSGHTCGNPRCSLHAFETIRDTAVNYTQRKSRWDGVVTLYFGLYELLTYGGRALAERAQARRRPARKHRRGDLHPGFGRRLPATRSRHRALFTAEESIFIFDARVYDVRTPIVSP